jgi:hypothetical protein
VSGSATVNVFLEGHSWVGQLGYRMTVLSLFERSTVVDAATGRVSEA